MQHMFCSLQAQDLPHITFPLQEHIRSCRKSEVIILQRIEAVIQLHLSAIRSRKETEVVVLRYWKTTIFWSAKKPLVHADKGMVHLVVVEPDLFFTRCKLYSELIQVLVTRKKILLQVIQTCDKFPGCI